MIAYGKQNVGEEEIQAVIDVLKSDYLTQGPKAKLFAEQIAEYVGEDFGAAFSSATAALHASCLALGVGEKSHVWVPAISFIATANCAEYCGAKVSFVDVEPDTGLMSVASLRAMAEKAIQGKIPRPDVIIPVHYSGQLVDLPEISRIADRLDAKIIEDASHSLGAEVPENWPEDVRGSIQVFSFHPVKMITSAEGGVAVTSDEALSRKLSMYGAHGIVMDEEHFEYPAPGSWYYEQQLLGFNYRLSDIHAAIGLAQLKKLPFFLDKRRRLASYYDSSLPSWVKPVDQRKNGISSYHLYPILVDPSYSSNVFEWLRNNNVMTQKHYVPIPYQPYYQKKYGSDFSMIPGAKTFYSQVMVLPLHPGTSKEDQNYVLKTLSEYQKKNPDITHLEFAS